MNLSGILPTLLRDPGASAFLAEVPTRGYGDVVCPVGVRAPLLVAASRQRPMVVITATSRRAEELAIAVRAYMPDDEGEAVAVLPAWETLPHERLSPRADTVAGRVSVFRRLAHPVKSASETPPARQSAGSAGASPHTRQSAGSVAASPTRHSAGSVAASPSRHSAVREAVSQNLAPTSPFGPIRILIIPTRALLQPVVAGLGDLEPVALKTGDTADLTDVAQRLTAAAYTRVDMVERRGEFAVRGGILDVFVPTQAHPVRIDFWGDEVTEIRWFSVADQRSLEIAEHGLWAPPCREILLTDAVRAKATALADTIPTARDMLKKLAEGIAVEGMESLAPVLVDQMVPVLSLVDAESLVVVDEPERIRRRAEDLLTTSAEFLAAAWTSTAAAAASTISIPSSSPTTRTPIDLSAASFLSFSEAQETAMDRHLGWWTFNSFGLDEDATSTITVAARDVQAYHGDFPQATADLKDLCAKNWELVLTTEGPGQATRIVEQLMAAHCPAVVVPNLTGPPQPHVVSVLPALVGQGFVAPNLNLAVFSEQDLTGRAGQGTRDMRTLPSRRRNTVDPLQLKGGDYIVHDQHGVGRFVEMTQRTMGVPPNAAVREYLVVEYAASKRGHPADRLYIPMEQLDQVTKYVGGESPTLSKMGGADWKNTRAKARKHVREIATELIRLYGARMATTGYAFSPDTPWQRELEDQFIHVETPDQLSTMDEVKADMEKPTPMDRLICGDVGYGKTEIAIRAAFKAVQDGKQVAVLVPTTLLVQQHYETFTDRFSGFPVNVAPLSRFQTAKESKAALEGLKDGSVDVVIGTHRLLTGTVQFKDLGLVIIDEEQRFGVEHKETLTQLRAEVDVLSMSATPIPRTLEMAVTGIREMSTLATPPEERHPVLTYVGAYDEKQITAAVRRELLREGQVFYIHNRVESIDRTAARLRELVPEAHIAVAHGKMSEAQLDRVIRQFWNREVDVLVCTTIVETGLDISNANTLILERADRMGLSQLHQLRGRVGRGRERAYAYFLYPPERPLTETAHDRLATMAANTDLGAGMQIAMKDLEIRGAGNLLGGEQSGHIAGVGFDLYVRMVGEAVAAFKGEAEPARTEVSVELPVDAHLPESYIGAERLRLEAYRKIAAAGDVAGLERVRAELLDRYGLLPEAAGLLFDVAALRLYAAEVGLAEITVQGRMVRFAPVELRESQALRLKRLYPGVVLKPAIRAFLVPFPTDRRVGSKQLNGQPLRGADILTWARHLIEIILEPSRPA
ncbi:MAG: transcription-repair coupling factor [Cellulomonadaceae bacterium]|nr:transcription-repair coupling factor [Cellulomonadaceae bacterium]